MRSVIERISLSFLFWLVGLCAVSAKAQSLEPGIYENLMLAVDGQGNLEGFFREDQGQGVLKRCAFFLSGKASAGSANVVTWSESIFPGVLAAARDGVRLSVPQGREHSGCGLVLLPQIAKGLDLDRTKKTAWLALRTIRVDRAYIHQEPAKSARLRAYLLKGDVVGILIEKGDWIQAEYPGRRGIVRGWLMAADTDKMPLPNRYP